MGPHGIFDAVEMLNPNDFLRLRDYASGLPKKRDPRTPLAGFWADEDLQDFSPRGRG